MPSRQRDGARPFLGQVVTVAAGAAAGQALVLGATPYLSRLYEPDDFGVFAIYIAIVTLLGSIASGRYELAIPLPSSRDDAASLLCVSTVLGLASSLALLVAVALFRHPVANLLHAPDLAGWLWTAPVSLCLVVFYEALKYWSTRHQRFSRLSVSTIARSAVSVVTQIVTGVVAGGAGGLGLLSGQVAGSATATAVMAGELRTDELTASLSRVTKPAMRRMASAYRKHPLHALSTSFLNTLSVVSLPLLVAGFLDPIDAGLVMMSQRVVVVPTQLFGQAIWQVTHARLGAIEAEQRGIFLRTVNRYACFLYAYPLTAIAMFSYFAEDVFGPQWDRLRLILPSIALMALLSAVSNATSYFTAMKLYRQESAWNLVLLVVRLAVLILVVPHLDVAGVVLAYAGASSLVYLGINLFWGRQVRSALKFATNLMTSVLASTAPLLLVRVTFGRSLVLSVAGVALGGLAYYGLLVRRLRSEAALSPGAASTST